MQFNTVHIPDKDPSQSLPCPPLTSPHLSHLSTQGDGTVSQASGSTTALAAWHPFQEGPYPLPSLGGSWVSVGGSSVLARLLLRYLSLSFLSMV